MWRISAVDFEFRFTDKSGVEEDMRQILDGLLHKDPNEIPSEGELIERLKSYAYVLVRFPDNKGISGGYFAPVKEMVKDYTPFFINNYLLLISPIRNASVTGSFCYGIENIDRDEYANRAVNNEKIVCLDKDKFMLALKNHAELHAKRLESEIGFILSSYIEEPCPAEFVHDIFLEYIRPIAELHGKVESGAIILNSMNKERLYKICFDTLQQWRVIPEKMSKLPPVIFEKFRDDNGYGEDTK